MKSEVSNPSSVAGEPMCVPASSAEFKRTSLRGGLAAVVAQGITFVAQTASMIVLARLLSPEDFGLQGMVVAATGLLGLFRDGGLGAAAVQRDVLTHEQASTLFWINVAVGTALMCMTAATAPFLAAFYNEPRLVAITLASGTAFVFNGLAVQHRALLYRSMRFVTMAKVDLFTVLTSLVVAVVVAALGGGYWALVAMAIANPMSTAVAVWIVMPWRPGPPARGSDIRSMLQFGGTLTFNIVVIYFAYNVDKVLLGRFWGAVALGLYGRAYQLANLPVQQLYTAISNVAMPALSRAQTDATRLRRSFLKGYAVVISMILPITIMCAVFAQEIVRVVLGPKWSGSAAILRLLAPTVFAFALVNPLGWLLLATGRVRRSAQIAMLIAVGVPAGVMVGLGYGPNGVASGVSIAMMVLLVPVIVWSLRNTGITLADYREVVTRPLVACAIAGVVSWSVEVVWLARLTPLLRLTIGVATLFVTYAAILLVVMAQRRFYVDLLYDAFRRARPISAEA